MKVLVAINDMGHFQLSDENKPISNPDIYKLVMKDIITTVDRLGFVNFTVKGNIQQKFYSSADLNFLVLFKELN
jgi:hypothetical protein